MAKSLAVVITHSLGWKTSDYFFLTNHRPRKSLPQNQWPIRGQYPRHVISQDQSEARKLWPRERLIDLSVTEGGTLTSSLQFSSFLQFLRSDGKCPVDTGTGGDGVWCISPSKAGRIREFTQGTSFYPLPVTSRHEMSPPCVSIKKDYLFSI